MFILKREIFGKQNDGLWLGSIQNLHSNCLRKKIKKQANEIEETLECDHKPFSHEKLLHLRNWKSRRETASITIYNFYFHHINGNEQQLRKESRDINTKYKIYMRIENKKERCIHGEYSILLTERNYLYLNVYIIVHHLSLICTISAWFILLIIWFNRN